MSAEFVPFNRPFLVGGELANLQTACETAHLSGDGAFTKKCNSWLEQATGSKKVLLTHSCTAALEMAAILGDIGPGDEVIMPSFTFVSTANAFALRGAVPVFVDISPDTLNINPALVAAAITPRTRAIAPVHYAGVSCDMDPILDLARRHNLLVIEDAAQGFDSRYKGKHLGAIGQFGALSFHETKNILSGEGGALLINDEKFIERAEIIREKGTNRSRFFRGQVDKYTWVDIGSSYLPSELLAAFLLAQLENSQKIQARRLAIWNAYHKAFDLLEKAGHARRPIIPDGTTLNAHMYYLLMNSLDERTRFLETLKKSGIGAVFHYIPLHSSPAGMRLGRAPLPMPVTDSLSDRIVRLPLWPGMEDSQERIIKTVLGFFGM